MTMEHATDGGDLNLILIDDDGTAILVCTQCGGVWAWKLDPVELPERLEDVATSPVFEPLTRLSSERIPGLGLPPSLRKLISD
jgi:hypothetical protein